MAFSTYRLTLSSRASSRRSFEPSVEMMMRSRSFQLSRLAISRSNCMPFITGMLRSVNTACTLCVSRIFSASSPFGA